MRSELLELRHHGERCGPIIRPGPPALMLCNICTYALIHDRELFEDLGRARRRKAARRDA